MNVTLNITPGPWYVETVKGADDVYISNDEVHIGRIFDPSDAAFIVRACNSHDKLVGLLREARASLEHQFNVSLVADIDAALAAAGEPV
jgi:hypothetical protein